MCLTMFYLNLKYDYKSVVNVILVSVLIIYSNFG
jgi:hypothetical protein